MPSPADEEPGGTRPERVVLVVRAYEVDGVVVSAEEQEARLRTDADRGGHRVVRVVTDPGTSEGGSAAIRAEVERLLRDREAESVWSLEPGSPASLVLPPTVGGLVVDGFPPWTGLPDG